MDLDNLLAMYAAEHDRNLREIARLDRLVVQLRGELAQMTAQQALTNEALLDELRALRVTVEYLEKIA